MTENQRSRVTAGLGALLVALGALFLAQQLFNVSWSVPWPFFIIAVGLACFAGVALGGRAAGPLAIPGAVITTSGLIDLYQYAFGHYETWAFAWTLLVVATGAGLVIDGLWRNLPRRAQLGRVVMSIGGALFVVGFAFFELALNLSGLTDALPSGLAGRTLGVLGALVLLALGAYLLISRSGNRAPRT